MSTNIILILWLNVLIQLVNSQHPSPPNGGRPYGPNPNNNNRPPINFPAIINAVAEELTNATMFTMYELEPRFVVIAGDAIINRPPQVPPMANSAGRIAGSYPSQGGPYASGPGMSQHQQQQPPNSRQQQYNQYPPALPQRGQYGPGPAKQPYPSGQQRPSQQQHSQRAPPGQQHQGSPGQQQRPPHKQKYSRKQRSQRQFNRRDYYDDDELDGW